MQKTEDRLLSEQLISAESYEKIVSGQKKFFSVGFEVKTLLYSGVLLVATGLGIAIYKNIDAIGHMAIILLIAMLSAGSFFYCFRKAHPYDDYKVESPNIYFDYVLLLGGLTLVSFTGYLQFQYAVFGTNNGLAFLIPSILLFAAAYYFDNLGILSMAITTLGAWAGIAVTPLSFFKGETYSLQPYILTGISLGILLSAVPSYLSARGIKKHFTFTYYNFAAHLFFVFTLTGLFQGNMAVYFILLVAVSALCIWYARSTDSFYFLLISIVYSYIGLSYVIIRMLFDSRISELSIYLALIYLIVSSFIIIRFLIRYKQKQQQQ